MYIIRIECPDRCRCQILRNAVSWIRKVLRCEKIWGDGNETLGCKLISNTANPRCEAEDFMYNNHNRCFCLSLRINDPGADAIAAGRYHHPLAVAGARR